MSLSPIAISVQQSPSWMPTIKPKKDGMTLSYFETDEFLSQLMEVDQFFPAPRTHFNLGIAIFHKLLPLSQ
jgi:hypothetical protein